MIKWAKELVNKAVEGLSSKAGEQFADHVIDKGGSIWGFTTNLEHLTKDLGMLRSLAQDTEDELKREESKGTKKRKREVQQWFEVENEIQESFRVLKTEIEGNNRISISHIRNVDRVEKLSKRVKKHMEDRKHLRELVLDHNERNNMKFLGNMYGATFKLKLVAILEHLKAHNVRMIGIYGADKSGKTTLAKQIYNKVIEETQENVYWVTVSANSSIHMLQEDISRALNLNLLDVKDVSIRAGRLHQALKQRRNSVLILDNLREYIDLHDVGCGVNEDGCQLIITTPSLRVFERQPVAPKISFDVAMNEDEAWDFFKEVYGNDRILTPPQEDFFRDKVNNRSGFPQRIINFARDPEGDESESE